MIVILELFNNTFIINFKIDKIVNAILLIHTYIYIYFDGAFTCII